MAYLGRHARISAAREVVWEILRRDGTLAWNPFTAREFYERHAKELDSSLKPLNPEASVKGIVKGTLQSLARKGLIQTTRRWADVIYSTNLYFSDRTVMRYNYGKALIEAQRLHLL